jgi:hypothetical protein
LALTLQDFGQTNPLSLEAIMAGLPKGYSVNDRTASVLAAGQSLITDPTMEGYQASKAEVLDPEARKAYVAKDQEIKTSVLKDSTGSLLSMIGDSAVAEEDKLKAYVGSQNVPKESTQRTSDLLAEQGIVADSGDETARASHHRSLAYDTIKTVNDEKAKLTAIINGAALNSDSTVTSKVVDVAELMVPFAEWNYYDKVLNQVVDNKDQAFLLGEKKKQLRDYVLSLPVESRAAFAEFILQKVQDTNVLLPDGNDLKKLQTLQDMFATGDYSDGERFFDDAMGLVDIAGLASLVGKGLGATVKGARAFRATEKAIGAPLNVEQRLAAEAKAFKPEALPTDPALQAEANAFKPADLPTDTALQAEANAFKSADPIEGSALAEEAKKFTPSVDDESPLALEAKAWMTRTEVDPSSPSQILKDVNPEIAIELHTAAEKDLTGEVAKALYGSSREEALAKDVLPEAGIKKGTIPNKVEMTPHFEEPVAIRNRRLSEGNTILNADEKATLINKITDGLKNIEGMNLHPSSLVSTYNADGTTTFFARYSPPNSGFTSPITAIENAKVAFRNYGMTEDNFTLLARRGSEWVETTTKELEAEASLLKAGAKLPTKAPTEYAIGMKYAYRIDPKDLDVVDNLTTAPGWISRVVQMADRMPTQVMSRLGQGSLVQHLLDAASVIHPQITEAASVVFDKAYGLRKMYIDQFKGFTDVYSKLVKERRALVTDYIHQANAEGIPFSETDLLSRGFNKIEIAALKVWRRANDIMWYANNEDMVRTLRALGTKVFQHSGSDTKLMGVPMSRG